MDQKNLWDMLQGDLFWVAQSGEQDAIQTEHVCVLELRLGVQFVQIGRIELRITRSIVINYAER